MADWHNASTDKLCDALLTLKTREECYALLEDVCTIKEVLDMAQRLSVAVLLNEKENYNAINKKTGASTATISRVAKCLEFGAGGYKKTISRLNGEKND